MLGTKISFDRNNDEKIVDHILCFHAITIVDRECCGYLFVSTIFIRLFVMLFDILSNRGRFTHLLTSSNIMSYHRTKSVHTNFDIFYCLHEFKVF